jgi:acyl-CoA synthetase (AMP-forming)/AMP-acid ligase II
MHQPEPETVLTELLARAVGADPDAPALLYREESISFAALDRRSAGFAGALAVAGLGRGTGCSCASRMCPSL